MYLNGPRVPKLGLPRVTMELNKSLNQSPQGGLEKIGYASSNGPPRNCCKIPDKYLIGHVLGGQNGGFTIGKIIYHFLKFSESLVVKKPLVVCTLSRLLGGFPRYTPCSIRINFINLCMKFLFSLKK